MTNDEEKTKIISIPYVGPMSLHETFNFFRFLLQKKMVRIVNGANIKDHLIWSMLFIFHNLQIKKNLFSQIKNVMYDAYCLFNS